MGPFQILTAANAPLTVTNITALGGGAAQTFSNPPLGTVGASAAGELALKVVIVGSSAAGSTAGVIAVQSNALSQGGLLVPSASTNGTQLQSRPARTSGVRLYLLSGASITYYFADTTFVPSGAPSNTVQQTTAGVFDEPLAGTDTIFVTVVSGTVLFRWVEL